MKNIEVRLGPILERELRSALKCYKTKAHFDMCVELYKLGAISKEEFIRRTQQDITFNP